jgi:chemotaxis protein methyltransferase CheR
MDPYGDITRKLNLEEREFLRLSTYIESNLGIRMPAAKKVMLESRLQKRLKQLNMKSFQEYTDYLFSTEGQKLEIPAMIDLVTTNKTDFYREPTHFDYLRSTIFPYFAQNSVKKPVRIWSAACSTGEEPYTIALECERFRESHPDFRFEIIASDISAAVLEKARKGIFLKERLAPLPQEVLHRYFLRSKDREKQLFRVKAELRKRLGFMRLNLMQDSFPFKEPFSIVFCRNVMIYFDRERQQKLLLAISRVMSRGGFLFLGHSETLTGHRVPFTTVAATIYQKSGDA